MKHCNQKVKPMSLQEFHEMINLAKQQKANGQVISHDDFKAIIKSWK
jgi:hypothetical protein